MCTRIFWNDNEVAKVVARTIDWEVSDEPGMWSLPRGLERHGGGGEEFVSWTSKHGSLSMSSWEGAAGEGVNEHGLAAHVLYLGEADYEPADERPALSNLLWVQYALDNFTSVAETLRGLEDLRIVPFEVHGFKMPIHLALEDASGDSAIVEMLGGKPVIHCPSPPPRPRPSRASSGSRATSRSPTAHPTTSSTSTRPGGCRRPISATASSTSSRRARRT